MREVLVMLTTSDGSGIQSSTVPISLLASAKNVILSTLSDNKTHVITLWNNHVTYSSVTGNSSTYKVNVFGR